MNVGTVNNTTGDVPTLSDHPAPGLAGQQGGLMPRLLQVVKACNEGVRKMSRTEQMISIQKKMEFKIKVSALWQPGAGLPPSRPVPGCPCLAPSTLPAPTQLGSGCQMLARMGSASLPGPCGPRPLCWEPDPASSRLITHTHS